MLVSLKGDLKKLANPARAKVSQRFFKTGKGEYGEGDVFLGINVPAQRELAKKYKDLLIDDIDKLLKSKIHEERLIALFILINNFRLGSDPERKQIFDF